MLLYKTDQHLHANVQVTAAKGGHTRYWKQRFTYFCNAQIWKTWSFFSINKWQRRVWFGSLCLLSGLIWKSDDVLTNFQAALCVCVFVRVRCVCVCVCVRVCVCAYRYQRWCRTMWDPLRLWAEISSQIPTTFWQQQWAQAIMTIVYLVTRALQFSSPHVSLSIFVSKSLLHLC